MFITCLFPQVAIFGAIALVFSVFGVNQGIFTDVPSLEAMAAGWLLLAIVNILWLLYFTSEENSLTLHLFNSFGTGGLTGPGRNGFRSSGRRTGSRINMQNGPGGGYSSGIASGPDYNPVVAGGLGSGPGGGYDAKEPGMGAGPLGASQTTLGGGRGGSIHSTGVNGRGAVMGGSPPAMGPTSGGGTNAGDPSTPLMAPGGPGSSGDTPIPETYLYRAKALYACGFEFLRCVGPTVNSLYWDV